MLSEEECGLWRAVAESRPGAREIYNDWLLVNAPQRGELMQRPPGELTTTQINERSDLWTEALGVRWVCYQIWFDRVSRPLPRELHFSSFALDRVEPIAEKLPFLTFRIAFASSAPENIAAAFAHPAMARIRALDFSTRTEYMHPDDELSPRHSYFGEAVLRVLCATPSLRHLEHLRFGDQQCGTQVGQLLAGAPFERLRTLSVSDEHIGDAGALALAASPTLRTVERLSLARCGIGADGAAALRALTWIPSLHLE